MPPFGLGYFGQSRKGAPTLQDEIKARDIFYGMFDGKPENENFYQAAKGLPHLQNNKDFDVKFKEAFLEALKEKPGLGIVDTLALGNAVFTAANNQADVAQKGLAGAIKDGLMKLKAPDLTYDDVILIQKVKNTISYENIISFKMAFKEQLPNMLNNAYIDAVRTNPKLRERSADDIAMTLFKSLNKEVNYGTIAGEITEAFKNLKKPLPSPKTLKG